MIKIKHKASKKRNSGWRHCATKGNALLILRRMMGPKRCLLTSSGLLCLLVLAFVRTGHAATISGKAVFKGPAPEVQKLAMDADPNCAVHHPGGVDSEEIVVNPNGTLKNVFVYVKDGLAGETFEAPQDSVVLDQKGCQYTPHVFGIQVNQPLVIRNSDDTLHNVHPMPEKNKPFNLGMPIQGMELKKKFSEPEVMIQFKCDVHPWMSAYGGVLAHPFFSVTNEEGVLKITDLPPGEYTVEAWHEKYGVQSQSVTLASAEETETVDFVYEG